jgi:hypothetical protein
MKAMLEPRIAAARTQVPRDVGPEWAGAVASDWSIESQGYFNADSYHEDRTTDGA